MSEAATPQVEVKVTRVPIPDGFLTQVGEEYALTQIQVGEHTVSVDEFLAMLEQSMDLKEITVSRSEKRAKTKFEMFDYMCSWKMDVSKWGQILGLVPVGQQRDEARKMVGRTLTKRYAEIEEFLSRAIHSAQQKDMIQPYWRQDQKPIF
jgi:hypothetical protein